MLTLTRKTDYALIALAHLAQDPTRRSSAREIASQYGVPLPLLMNLLKLLTQRGFARSSRGPRGGYSLGTSADQISLNDIVQAIEGPVQLVQCVDQPTSSANGEESACDLMCSCPVRSPIHKIHERLVEFLSGITLADLLDGACSCTPQIVELRGDKLHEAVDLSR
jgi:Rrf2 family protein